MTKNKITTTVLLLTLSFSMVVSSASAFATDQDNQEPETKEELKTAKIAVPFVKNEGQEDEEVAYYASTFAGTLYVTEQGELVYSLPKYEKKKEKGTREKLDLVKGEGKDVEVAGGAVLKEVLVNADTENIKIEDKGQSETKINYFKGNNKDNWKINIETVETLNFGEVYPGIEMELKAYNSNVEKLFFVSPDANPSQIKLSLDGTEGIKISKDGELVLETELGEVSFSAPVAYQKIEGKKKDVEVEYNLSKDSYGFELGEYNKDYELVIDPLLASTYAGGSHNDFNSDLKIDSEGNVFVLGFVYSAGYPIEHGEQEWIHSGGGDIVVSKFSNDLKTLISTTYIGGNGSERGYEMALDSSNNAYIVGGTDSVNYPITVGAYQENNDTDSHEIVISKLNNDLDSLISSTYIGGSDHESGHSVALDSAENVYITGYSSSSDYPVTDEAYQASKAGYDNIVVSKLNKSLTSLVASTFIGGSDFGVGQSIALDNSDNVYVLGYSDSDDYPTTKGAYQNKNRGFDDIVVSKLDSELVSLIASTFIGGDEADRGHSIAVDDPDDVYILGFSKSEDYPITKKAYQKKSAGMGDIVVSKLDSDFASLEASTYIGGAFYDYGQSITLDNSKNIYIVGYSNSENYPITTKAHQSFKMKYDDIVVSKLNKELDSLVASTFLGGNGSERGYAVVTDDEENIYISGESDSMDYPTSSEAHKNYFSGGFTDIAVSKLLLEAEE